MADVVPDKLIEIYYRKDEGKRAHFKSLRIKTGVRFEDMLFFDDAKENIDAVSELGVVCQHTPDGLTAEAWRRGLEGYVRSLSSGGSRQLGGGSKQLAKQWIDRRRAEGGADPTDAALAEAAYEQRLARSRRAPTLPAPVKEPLPTRQGPVSDTPKGKLPLLQKRRQTAVGPLGHRRKPQAKFVPKDFSKPYTKPRAAK